MMMMIKKKPQNIEETQKKIKKKNDMEMVTYIIIFTLDNI